MLPAAFALQMVKPTVDVGAPQEGDKGPPATYPGLGQVFSPEVGKKRAINATSNNQVLIINCHGSNTGPGSATWTTYSPRTAAQERLNQKRVLEELTNPYIEQVSYGKQSFTFTVSNFYALPETDTHYFWLQDDIDQDNMNKNDKSYVGKLRSNFLGTEFYIYNFIFQNRRIKNTVIKCNL